VENGHFLKKMTSFVNPKALLCYRVRVRVTVSVKARVRVRVRVSGNTFSIKCSRSVTCMFNIWD